VKLGKGYQPDPINHRRTPFAVLAQALGLSSSTLPESTDNCVTIGAVVPVLDQSQTSACVGHAIACAVGGGMALAGSPIGFVPSPAEIYRNARAIDRGPGGPALVDDGAQPNQGWRAVSTFGVRPMIALGDRVSDADPATINAEPGWSDLLGESAAIVKGEYALAASGAARVLELRMALSGKRPVTVALHADGDPFQYYAGDVLTGAMLGDGPDHYVTLIDYAIVGGAAVFLGRNSWGEKATGWGVDRFALDGLPASWRADGHFLVDASAVQTMADLVVADLRAA